MAKFHARYALFAAALLCLSCLAPARSAAQAVKQRSDIDPKYKWDLTSLFPSDEAWAKALEELRSGIGQFAQYRGKLAGSPENIGKVLQLRDRYALISDNLYVYAHLKFDEDHRVSKAQEMDGQAQDANAKLAAAVSYIQPELLSMDTATLAGYAETDPVVKQYAFQIKDLIRSKAHILSDKEEALLAAAGPVMDAPQTSFRMIDEADISFGTIKDENGKDLQLSEDRYSTILHGPDRRMRKDAFNMYEETHLKYVNGLGSALASSVKKDYFLAKARKYNTCLEQALDNNNIPESVFRNLISATNANLEPLHKWVSLRKKILGLDEFHPYDRYATLFKEKPRDYSWEEAKATVLEGLSPLGPAYLAEFRKGLDSGWIDVYASQGKAGGGYNWGTYSSHPYILLNYNGSLNDVSTLAHEMGHAMNSLWTNRAEPYQYGDHSLFTAEVASTCNEAILMKYLIEHAKTKQEKEYLLARYIEQIVGTVYTQVMFSEFELAIHERVENGGSLSVDFFRKTYRDLMQKYWGPELVIDPLYDLAGMQIWHFYREYYVYQYATSYAAAQALSDKILNKEPGALEAYQQFLRTGTSAYPVDILKKAGVDMTTPEPVDRTLKLFAGLVDQMDKLLNEKGN